MKRVSSNKNLPSRATSPAALATRVTAIAACLGGMLVSPPAQANEFALHVEPAAALWLDDPQSDRFGPGFYLAVRPSLVLGRIVSLQATYAVLVTPARDPFTENGSAQFALGGLRLRPFAMHQPEEKQLAGFFMDFNLGYVRTEDLDRFGFDGGVGYNFQPSPVFAMGPVVRYSQIMQPNDVAAEDPNDAQFLSVGLNFSFGPRHREDEVVEPAAATPCPTCPTVPEAVECEECEDCADPVECPEPVGCVDPDADGVCEGDDRCPNDYGPAATLGCPVDPCSGAPLVVLVQFPYDSSEMPAHRDEARLMDPVLEAVAEAIAQDPTCRVCITGHASDEGSSDYNLELSRDRAEAVQAYLEGNGINESRMPTSGMGDQCQLVPTTSRVLNRRVEFRRLEEGESCSLECAE